LVGIGAVGVSTAGAFLGRPGALLVCCDIELELKELLQI
jgi:hypothetical protein